MQRILKITSSKNRKFGFGLSKMTNFYVFEIYLNFTTWMISL